MERGSTTDDRDVARRRTLHFIYRSLRHLYKSPKANHRPRRVLNVRELAQHLGGAWRLVWPVHIIRAHTRTRARVRCGLPTVRPRREKRVRYARCLGTRLSGRRLKCDLKGVRKERDSSRLHYERSVAAVHSNERSFRLVIYARNGRLPTTVGRLLNDGTSVHPSRVFRTSRSPHREWMDGVRNLERCIELDCHGTGTLRRSYVL